MSKKTLLIVYGGASLEHTVSIASAVHVVSLLNNKFDIECIYIDTKNRMWWVNKSHIGKELYCEKEAVFAMNRGCDISNFYAALPLIHGKGGEDGTIIGFLQSFGIPVIAANIVAHAITFDKAVFKSVLAHHGIQQAKSIVISSRDYLDIDNIRNKLGDVLCIKPAMQGSSIGISYAKGRKEIEKGIATAFLFDSKIVIEEYIKGNDYEVSLCRDDETPYISYPARLSYNGPVYSHTLKTKNVDAVDITMKPKIHVTAMKEINEIAKKLYHILSMPLFLRVDFFIDESNRVYCNEVNTIPGMTPSSLFLPMLIEKFGSEENALYSLIEKGVATKNSSFKVPIYIK